jgi:hypothetical protein
MPKIGVFRAYIDVFDPEKDVLRKRGEPGHSISPLSRTFLNLIISDS